MAATFPPSHADLLTNKKAFAHLATLMSDGTPQVTPVWFDFHEGHIRVNSAKGRVKDRNIRKNGAVAIAISDPENPYRHIAIRGHVVNITEQGADAHIDSLSLKYLGKEKYPWAKPDSIRVIYDIEPTSVSVMG